MTEVLIDGPEQVRDTLILAPGASGGVRTGFLSDVARELAKHDIRTIRFEFEQPRAPKALQNWRSILEKFGNDVFIGGKSFGGRMASMIADEYPIRGLVCLGYPFHPPSQPEKLRTKHLETLKTRTLIVQGTRDPFGTRKEVDGYKLSNAIEVEWIEGADHSFRNRDHIARTVAEIVRFITSHG